MRHVKRHTLATAVLLTVLSTATACSSDSDDSTGDTMTLSGNCSITDHSLSPKAVVSESMVEKLLGSDDWTAKRGLSVSPRARSRRLSSAAAPSRPSATRTTSGSA